MGLIMRIYTRNIHSRRGFIFLKNKADLFSRNDTWVLNQPYYVVGYGYSQQYNVYVYVYTYIYIIIINYIYIYMYLYSRHIRYIYIHQNLGRNIANYSTTQKTLENWDPHIMIIYILLKVKAGTQLWLRLQAAHEYWPPTTVYNTWNLRSPGNGKGGTRSIQMKCLRNASSLNSVL